MLDYTLLSFLHTWNMFFSMYIRNSKDVWIRLKIGNFICDFILHYNCEKLVKFLLPTKMSNSKVTVGYWDCRGLAHPIILLLEFLKKPYELKNPSKELIGPPPKVLHTIYKTDYPLGFISNRWKAKLYTTCLCSFIIF